MILRIRNENGEWVSIPAIKGEPGEKGEPGKDGYTPIKGVDYFDGTMTFEDLTPEQKASLKGDKGDPGKDGYTPIKGVDYFDGAPGEKGDKGDPGYTPVKGVDYFDGDKGEPGDDYVLTEEDKAEIAGLVEVPENSTTPIEANFSPSYLAMALTVNRGGDNINVDQNTEESVILNALYNGVLVYNASVKPLSLDLNLGFGISQLDIFTVANDGSYTRTYDTINPYTLTIPGFKYAVRLAANSYAVGDGMRKFFQNIYYDNSTSGLTSKTIPGAINELKTLIDSGSGGLTEEEVIALIEEYGGGGEALPNAEEVEF